MSNVDFGNPHDSHRSLRPNHSYGPSPWGYGCHGWGYPRYGGGGALLMGYMLGRAAQNNQRPQVVYTNVPSPQTYPNYPPQAQYHYHYNSQPPGQYPPPSQVQGYPPPPGGYPQPGGGHYPPPPPPRQGYSGNPQGQYQGPPQGSSSRQNNTRRSYQEEGTPQGQRVQGRSRSHEENEQRRVSQSQTEYSSPPTYGWKFPPPYESRAHNTVGAKSDDESYDGQSQLDANYFSDSDVRTNKNSRERAGTYLEKHEKDDRRKSDIEQSFSKKKKSNNSTTKKLVQSQLEFMKSR